MLKAEEIISGLQSIVDDYSEAAMIWHVAFYILIVALIVKWRPSSRFLGILLCLPLLSVAVFAWLAGNPFNGTMFSLAALLILIFAIKSSNQPVTFSKLPFAVSGMVMIVFGIVYPHFINPGSIFTYLYASPAGLIPCPTISILTGLLLLINGSGFKSITITFVVLGLFYGVFGVFKLAVYLDLFLLFGSIILLIKYILSFRVPAVRD
jgi:hypothetical protein